jgi:hypothetical protein
VICTVKGGFTDLHAMVSGLNNGILLSMEAAAELMSLPRRNTLSLPEAAHVEAMVQSRGSPIITCRQDLLIFDEDRSDLPSQASRPLRNEMSDIHEILFPRGAMRGRSFFLFIFQG